MIRVFAAILWLSTIAMAVEIVPQSSTSHPLVFLMIDSSDHVSAKTGLTCTVTLSKAGGSFASPSGSVSEIGSGWYKCAGNATDTATLGPLILHATGTGADPADVRFCVVAYDDQSATRGTAGTAIPAVASGNAGAIITAGTGTGQISLSAGSVAKVNLLADDSLTAGALSLEAAEKIFTVPTSAMNTPTSAGSIMVSSLDASINAVKAKTDNLPASPASTTNITAGTITTVTNLTNLPGIPTNWITAAGLASDAVSEIAAAITPPANYILLNSDDSLSVAPGADAIIQLNLHDGTDFVTGASLVIDIVRRSDRNHWTGSAWQSGSTTVSMTEVTAISGLYAYTLTSAAIGTSAAFFDWTVAYNNVTTRGTVSANVPTIGTSGTVTTGDLSTAALAKFVTQDTGETEATDGSVASFGGSGGGGLTDDEHDWLLATYGKLGSTTVTVQSPVAANATLTLVQGTDYLGGTLTVTRTAWSGESVVGGSASLYVMTKAAYEAGTGASVLGPIACTFTNGLPASTIVVTMPLTAAQTASLTPSPAQNPLNYVYQVVGTTSGGHKYSIIGPAACTVKRGLQ